MVLARDAATSVRGVLGQLAGFGIAAYRPERPIQKACDRPHVLMIVAERGNAITETLRAFTMDEVRGLLG